MIAMPKTAKVGIIFAAVGIAVGIGIALLIVNNQNREVVSQQPESDINKPEVASNFGFYNVKQPSTLVVGENGSFIAFSGGGKEPYAFEWKFSDGVNLNGKSITRSFGSPGTYHFTVTITDALGRQVKTPDFNVQVYSREIPEEGRTANATSSTDHN
jgi:hypothetical protein